jgi:hypothetical protein
MTLAGWLLGQSVSLVNKSWFLLPPSFGWLKNNLSVLSKHECPLRTLSWRWEGKAELDFPEVGLNT